jgi:hypothetical protein
MLRGSMGGWLSGLKRRLAKPLSVFRRSASSNLAPPVCNDHELPHVYQRRCLGAGLTFTQLPSVMRAWAERPWRSRLLFRRDAPWRNP